ncbi:hypothetical protein NUW58_g1591 [Xylaria curta]|uniref:Uncharacterized protein n=1 Tax=Xylaria curta TaxID=42375 RepID=A0ACC1PJG0_9PEZI|nr:hypothetical protein NUW58_g1591 [Xylaria curta]
MDKPTALPEDETPALPAQKTPHPPRFWIIIVSLSLLAFISALDALIVSTALPKITEEIGGATQYVWIANSFVIASTVPQPMIGQLADIFGRKNAAALISGRSVQGAGAGGIYVLIDIVCCDLIALRDRGKYLGVINAWAAVAAAIGPVLGGAFARSNWRWIFYLNIPVCAIPLATLLIFMRMKTGTANTQKQFSKVSRIDYIGSIIFIPSLIALIFGLVAGGVEFPWSSWRIILPLVIGIVGWIGFHVYEHFIKYPSVPTRLFSNRTSAAAYLLAFLSSVLATALSYFLPIYFQGVLGATAFYSGVYIIPTAIGTLLFAVIAGVLLSHFGAYRPLHASAFALAIIGFGLFQLLYTWSPPVAWVFFQLIAAAGVGIPVSTCLPAIMAALPESDVASSTAMFSFVKTFGYVWGVTVPSILFNAVFNNGLPSIPSSDIQDQLRNGGSYAFASQISVLRDTLDPALLSQIQDLYTQSLRAIWWFGLGISALGFIVVFFERGLELSTELKTEYGLDGEKGSKRRQGKPQ